ncbi:uncharacterized protein N7525_001180 [Penicillium rubens]|uniref:uncharacterized protein n=1 Tax=Penicillium rubens TaxID=1108849 RepID=UPI002398E7FC|nr:uncharacterized protein N7525_001180 [Penicillium rubens]KAJ5276936.1 hypothetical protein N7524_003089 [Penicillium chrysogenum]KAJ5843439.1 hypothetical protein N7525_001180 [Penicillium rubens]KAJ5845976.1 hypothetical protein N7534_009645 [Penicillium rubens]
MHTWCNSWTVHFDRAPSPYNVSGSHEATRRGGHGRRWGNGGGVGGWRTFGGAGNAREVRGMNERVR